LNKKVSASLYTEALVHQIYALGCISANAVSNETWATLKFFLQSVIDGRREAEKTEGLR
jgi:hypothetical protein